ncbi:olfactory receptor 11L1-like [Pelodytes ibericus]
MLEMNQTRVTEFVLLGFQNLQSVATLFFFLLIFYCVTISGNIIIIFLVVLDNSLHSPMYFFLTQLSISDILMTTNIVPNTLYVVLGEGGTISFTGCITQFYFFGGSECLECLLLTVMAYDRYLAICSPLHYTSIMSYTCFTKLVIVSWLLSFSLILVSTLPISRLWFCGPNVIDHFFCDFAPLIELSCSDTSTLQMVVVLMCLLVIALPLIIITVSYAFIILAILKISSTSGRWKSFSTCSSHLLVVCIFYGALISIYILPHKGISMDINKVLSLMYTMITPMLNPIIYSLRNKDIIEAMKKSTSKLHPIR